MTVHLTAKCLSVFYQILVPATLIYIYVVLVPIWADEDAPVVLRKPNFLDLGGVTVLIIGSALSIFALNPSWGLTQKYRKHIRFWANIYQFASITLAIFVLLWWSSDALNSDSVFLSDTLIVLSMTVGPLLTFFAIKYSDHIQIPETTN